MLTRLHEVTPFLKKIETKPSLNEPWALCKELIKLLMKCNGSCMKHPKWKQNLHQQKKEKKMAPSLDEMLFEIKIDMQA